MPLELDSNKERHIKQERRGSRSESLLIRGLAYFIEEV